MPITIEEKDSIKEYDLTFIEAIQAMSEGLEVECEGERGAYRMDKSGNILHYVASYFGFVNACIDGKQGSRKWRIVELSRYI